MRLSQHQYNAPASRVLEIVAGLIMAVFGIVLIGVGVYAIGLGLLRTDISPRNLWIFVGVVAAGSFCSLIAWRLLGNRPRRNDQGLFGPTVLRFGGIILLLGGMLIAVFHFPYGLFHLLGSAAAATACFALARARTEQETRWPVDGDAT